MLVLARVKATWGVTALNPRLMAGIPTEMPRAVFIPKGLQPLAWGRVGDPRSPLPKVLRLWRSRSTVRDPSGDHSGWLWIRFHTDCRLRNTHFHPVRFRGTNVAGQHQ